MNPRRLKTRFAINTATLVFIFGFTLAPATQAQPITITGTVTIPDGQAAPAAGVGVEYVIGNDALLLFQGSGAYTTIVGSAGGAYILQDGSNYLKIGPSTPGGNGRVVFDNYYANGQAGVMYSGIAGAWFDLTNVTFTNNHVGATRGGGAIYIVNASATLTNARFEGNYAGQSGAIRNRGPLIVRDSAFVGNYAMGPTVGYGGVLHNESTYSLAFMNNSSFERNRAINHGGVASLVNGNITFLNSTFTNNWAGSGGGVIGAASSGTIKLTLENGVTNYNYIGNYALALANTSVLTETIMASGTTTYAPAAKGGGFLNTYNANAKITFDISDGVSLAIGAASTTNRNYDTIASGTGNLTITTANIYKAGGGDLILNANNSYYASVFTISGGRVLLGNQEASLGGNITVNSGATLGGSGTFKTLSLADVELAATVTAKAGSFIQVGNGGPNDKLAFSVSSTLKAESGVTFNYNLHDNNKAGSLQMNNFQIAGSGTINLVTLASGTFSLASWTTTNLPNSSIFSLLLNGVGASARANSELSIAGGNTLQLIISSILYSDDLTWTGSNGDFWQAGGSQFNWLGTTTGGAVRDFQKGDTRVIFDGALDAAHADNRTITVASDGVSTSNMTVSGTASYTFGGGAIAITGTLLKSGTGKLTFANDAANTFNTVHLRNGTMEVSNVAQLGGGLAKIDGNAFGAEDSARVLFSDNLVLDNAGGVTHRLELSDTSATLGARNAGIAVADGKIAIIQNALTSSAGAALSIGAGNTFEAGAAVPAGTGAIIFQSNTSTLASNGAGAVLQRGNATFNNATFDSNYSASRGGAIANDTAASVLTLNNTVFTGNTAAGGGALYNSGTINYNITRTGTFINAGNTATTAGAGSGFLDQSTANSVLNINVSPNATLVIGAANASADGIAGVAGSKISKTGAGDWLLKSDSSKFLGATSITQGRFLLGGQGAKIGGAVTVGPGATAGGIGEFAGSLTINSGTLFVGARDAANAQSLSIANLTLASSVLDFSLHNDGAYDIVKLGTLNPLAGTSKVNVDSFLIGDFLLATGAAADMTRLAALGVTMDGSMLSGGRQSLRLEASGTNLMLKGESGPSCIITWTGTGAQPTRWDSVETNWKDTPDGTFAGMDRVIFNELPAGASHTIEIIASSHISDMEVSGAKNYTFIGEGGITARAGQQYGTAFVGTGKLTKQGSGTLTFDNDGANIFQGGIDIYEGTIAFNNGNKLGVAASSITFKGNATLKTIADAGTLAGNIIIESGKFATIDTGDHTLTYSGSSGGASGTIIKTGGGSLIYSGQNALAHGATRVNDGLVKLTNITDYTIAHRFELNGGWVDLSDSTPPNPANEWVNLVFSGSLGGVIGSNDSITIGAGERLYGLGDPAIMGKQGVYVIVNAGAGGVAKMTGSNNYMGNTRLKSGTLQVSADDQLGLVSANREIKFEGGSLEIISNNFTTQRPLEIRAAEGTVSVAVSATATLNGVISGAGILTKDGAGTLVLSSTNTHAGTKFKAGTIVLGNRRALGDGAMSVAGDNVQLNIAVSGNTFANTFNLGGHAFVIDTGGYNTTFNGPITGGGILTLQGGGKHTLAGSNFLGELRLRQNTGIVAKSVTALGGKDSSVSMETGSTVEIQQKGTLAKNMNVGGGEIIFKNINSLDKGEAMLKIYGAMTLTNSSTIALDTPVGSRAYLLVHGTVLVENGGNFVFNSGTFNANTEVFYSIGDKNQNLLIAGLDMSTNPGKDIVVSFDSVIASMNAVHSRLTESFLLPLVERADNDPESAFWLKTVGSFGDFNGDGRRIGFSDSTYGGIVGYDTMISKNLLVGLHAGYSISMIDTVNDAETEAHLPYFGAYGAIRLSPFYISLGVLGGEVEGQTTRQDLEGRIVGTYKGLIFGGSAEVGFLLNIWEGASLMPSIALNYMNYKYKDQQEVGPGAIFVDNFSKDVWESFASVTFSQKFYTMPNKLPGMLDVLFGWRESLKNDAIVTTAGLAVTPDTKFRITSDEYSRRGCTLGIGLRFALTQKLSLGVTYDCNLTSDYNRHNASFTLRWIW